jgi:hypothetical protein
VRYLIGDAARWHGHTGGGAVEEAAKVNFTTAELSVTNPGVEARAVAAKTENFMERPFTCPYCGQEMIGRPPRTTDREVLLPPSTFVRNSFHVLCKILHFTRDRASRNCLVWSESQAANRATRTPLTCSSATMSPNLTRVLFRSWNWAPYCTLYLVNWVSCTTIGIGLPMVVKKRDVPILLPPQG